jgi:hypothetical protein
VREDEWEVGKNIGQKGKDIGSFGGSGYRSGDVTGRDSISLLRPSPRRPLRTGMQRYMTKKSVKMEQEAKMTSGDGRADVKSKK